MHSSLLKLSLLLGTLVPAAAHANTVYDAAADFPTVSNMGGNWAYGSLGDGAGFTFSNNAFMGQSGLAYWSFAPDTYFLVGHNTSGSGQGTFNPTANELWIHPGPNSTDDAAVAFRAPISGLYNIAGFFERVDTSNGAGDGVDVAIYSPSGTLASAHLGTTYLNSYAFNQTLSLTAGDIFYFDVSNAGTYFNDSTGLQLTITQVSSVPEPSSLALLGTGVLGFVGFARRRFKA